MKNQQWHALEVKRLKEKLNLDLDQGLSSSVVEKLLLENGKNELPQKKKQNLLLKFAKHFHDVLIYILMFAAVVTALMEHYIDTAVIFLVAFINAFIGFIQENKAEQALEGIKKMLSLHARVLRDGKKIDIAARDLVIGDLVFLSPGDKVPADLRLLNCEQLRIEESALTGESVASEKTTEAVNVQAVLGDRKNMAFSGTSVASGSGYGVVVATGIDTELGKISKSIDEVEQLKTPLLKQITLFGKQIAVAILMLAVVMYAFGYFVRGFAAGELMLFVIGLSVAAIPEGLPAIVSIILAVGVQNMARRKAIVRNLPSVETLGAVSVICSDKTGTLTKNEMTVTTVSVFEEKLSNKIKDFNVTGTGYEPHGQIEYAATEQKEQAVKLSQEKILHDFLTCVSTCNDASLQQDEDGLWQVYGGPTEGCLLTLAAKADQKIVKRKVISKIPFSSEYKYMAVLVEEDGQKVIYVKGAPDQLFTMSKNLPISEWEKKVTAYANLGKRVIGAARKTVNEDKLKLEPADIESGLEFLGVAAIIDPPREQAITAIRECAKAGIKVKMITGDHKQTALAIGKMMGIGNDTGAVEGKEIDELTDEQLQVTVMERDIFARTSPNHKLRLVQALQANGLVCAMTGDGVNDAPALKRADIGVAMGVKGTEVAKEAAQMVLVDDNFDTLVSAVEEGRRVYSNLKKTILFILPTNGAEALVIMTAIILGIAMPITPVQILWVNMVTAVTLALALAFEKIESGEMLKPPRPLKTPLLSSYYIFRIIFVSLLIGGCTLLFNNYLIISGYEQAVIHTLTLHTLVILQLAHLFNCRNELNFAFDKNFFSNKIAFLVAFILIGLQFLIIYTPFMNMLFGTTPVPAEYWLVPVLLGLIVFIVVEIEKAITKKIIAARGGR